MSPQVLQILQAIATAGPVVGQAIIALIQALSGQHPSNTADIHAEITRVVGEAQADPPHEGG